MKKGGKTIYLGHDAWFRQQVKKGLGQFDRGEFLTRSRNPVRAHVALVDVRWSPAASEEFVRIVEYIRQGHPSADLKSQTWYTARKDGRPRIESEDGDRVEFLGGELQALGLVSHLGGG